MFYSSTSIFLCTQCKKKLEISFSTIRTEALGDMEKNRTLNEMFDSYIEKEEMLKHSNHNDSLYFNSSKMVREYMFSLLEEVHRFAYHACFECYLYCDMFEESDPLFFSDRYFLTNSAIKVIGAWEKLYFFYAILFEIDLDTNQKNNSFNSLQRKLKKTEFTKTQVYSGFINLKSKGSFKLVDEARKFNDHNISYHLGNNYQQMTAMAKGILENTTVLYKGIEEALTLLGKRVRLVKKNYAHNFTIVKKVEENEKVFRKKALKIKSKFKYEDINKIYVKSVDYQKWAERRLEEASSWKIKYSYPPLLSIYYRLIDVTVRLHESTRSLAFAYNMFSDAVRLKYADLDKFWIKFQGMNYRYFIHSALIRIYSTYDKIAVIIRELFEVELNNASLEKTVEFIKTNEETKFYNTLPPFKIINRILSNKSYKKLYDTRQDFFHQLVMQDFMNPAYKEIIDIELVMAIIDNCKMVYELIDSIDIALIHFHEIGTYHENKGNY